MTTNITTKYHFQAGTKPYPTPKDFNPDKKYDLIIVGLGTAGITAALTAGQRGLNILVIEKTSYAGGTNTGGGVCGFYIGGPTGLTARLTDQARQIQQQNNNTSSIIEIRKKMYDDLLAQYNIDIKYNCRVRAVIMDSSESNKQIAGVIWTDESGNSDYALAKVVDDASADAIVCKLAGCQLTQGRESDKSFQPYTWSMLCLHGNSDTVNVAVANIDAGYADQTDPEQWSQSLLSDVTMHLQDQYTEKHTYIMASDIPGLREGWRIVSEPVYSFAAALNSGNESNAADVTMQPVDYVKSNIDTHAMDIALESTILQDWLIASSLWGEEMYFPIPLTSLFPADCNNLIAAARHLGVDHDIGHALRMNAAMGQIGVAAGLIAVQCCKNNLTPAAVPYSAIARDLELPESPLAENRKIWGLTDAEIVSLLDSDKPGRGIWSGYVQNKRQLLTNLLTSQSENCRCHAAISLGLLRDPGALPILRKMVETRDSFVPTTSRKYNHARGYTAVYLLGRFPDREAVSMLLDCLAGDNGEFTFRYRSNAFVALLSIAESNADLREFVVSEMLRICQTPGWNLEYELKGMVSFMKNRQYDFVRKFAPVFNATVKRWGMSGRIIENRSLCRQ